MAFTDQEKARVLHFLGYASWVSLAQSIQLGYPAASQPLFLVEDAFNRITPDGENSIRRDLCELESIERQMSEGRQRLATKKVGEVEFNQGELGALRSEYLYWQRRLADDFGVVPNPYAQATMLGLGGGINARVSG